MAGELPKKLSDLVTAIAFAYSRHMSETSVPMLLPDGPVECCGQLTTYIGGVRGPMAGSVAVHFHCTTCGERIAEIVPAGPSLPNESKCWSCGGARDDDACAECGLPIGNLDAIAVFVRTRSDVSDVAGGLLQRGFYRTGLALLHCAALLRPDDERVRAMRDPLLAGTR